MEDISYGGWGGRYALKGSKEITNARLYQAAKGDKLGIAQWIAGIQSDFAMRADWCVTENYDDANHLPTVTVEEGIDLTADAGASVTFHASAEDPDGDALTYRWYHYPWGDTYEEEKDEDKNPVGIPVNVSEDGSQAEFTVPADAKSGNTIHIILECVDGGGTNPIAYQRVIITVN